MTHLDSHLNETVFSSVCYTRQIGRTAIYQMAFALEWCNTCKAAHITAFQNWGQVIPSVWFNDKTPARTPRQMARGQP